MKILIVIVFLKFHVSLGFAFYQIPEKFITQLDSKDCDSPSIEGRAKALSQLLPKLNECSVQEKFFNCFPKNFNDFRRMFGYENVSSIESKYGPLYDESQNFIDAFFTRLTVINHNRIIKKTIILQKKESGKLMVSISFNFILPKK